MDVSDVRCARSGNLAIAYSVSGDGPIDTVLLLMMTNVGHALQRPRIVGIAERLGSFSRAILLDRRGTGLSDRPERLPDLKGAPGLWRLYSVVDG